MPRIAHHEWRPILLVGHLRSGLQKQCYWGPIGGLNGKHICKGPDLLLDDNWLFRITQVARQVDTTDHISTNFLKFVEMRSVVLA